MLEQHPLSPDCSLIQNWTLECKNWTPILIYMSVYTVEIKYDDSPANMSANSYCMVQPEQQPAFLSWIEGSGSIAGATIFSLYHSNLSWDEN